MTDNYLKEKKLAKRIVELDEYRYTPLVEMNDWRMEEDVSKEEVYPPEKWSNMLRIGETWRGRDRYLWINHEIELPVKENLWFKFDFGRTGGGYNSGFESLLFLDGKPYQGVDSNHTEVFIDPSYYGKHVSVSLKLWSGLEGGGQEVIQVHQLKCAQLTTQNIMADQLFYMSNMMSKTISELSDNDPTKYLLLNQLDAAFRVIDWSYPGSDQFYDTIELANEKLNNTLEGNKKESELSVTAVGHTHIDVAWLWRLKHTAEKTARSFSTVLRLMEQYPDYYFLQTQPQLYKYIKNLYPEMYVKIKERIAEGRWEVDGAMWLEADCNIPSGESLTRQILHGKKFVKDEFGKQMNYLWLPDVFGYSWALPQILKKSGIHTFMTTKISWNQYNRMPHDTFYWKGIDGTAILTHFVTTPPLGDTQGWESKWFYTYNGELEPSTVLGSYQAYQDKALNNELLISYGYGDGGGGVNREMLENRRAMDKIPGLPTIKTGKAKDYFERLHQTIEHATAPVSEWDGELYLEYHRGTYTSQAFVKKINRKIELKLRETEILFSLFEMAGEKKYPKEKIYDTWEILLRNQFHDIIPGSSIKEVYKDHKKEAKTMLQSIEFLNEELKGNQKDIYTVYNTNGFSRTSLVDIEETREGVFKNLVGEIVPSVQLADRHAVLIDTIPPFQEISLIFEEGTLNGNIHQVESNHVNRIETPFYVIEWEASGEITKLYDKENQRNVLLGSGNVFQLFEDKPLDYDAWDIDVFYSEKEKQLSATRSYINEKNDLFTSIMFEYDFGRSKIIQEMIVYQFSRRIDFKTNVHWEERQQLLKVKFDVDVRSNEATYDIQYGNVKRATHNNTSWDFAQFETVGHQWADLSEAFYGVSLLNDSKYGYDIKGNSMRLTLLKGAIYPDPTADIGEHEFTYSLLPHSGNFIVGKTVEEAWEINSPLSFIQKSDSVLPKLDISIEGILMIDAIKKAESSDGWILRFHDHTGGRRTVKISMKGMKWQETNLMEEPISEPYFEEFEIELDPYEIKTFKLVSKD
ncbi:alpha-mannosidase [Enterococcus sp. LJL99]